MSTYVFNNIGVQAPDRFAALELYDPWCRERLLAAGLRDGMRCLEVGAGNGSIAGWLAQRVRPNGSVVATDIDTAHVPTMPAEVEVRRHDIVADPLPENEFDLVHARLVLLHLPDRLRALHRIWHALRPGGVLVLNEFDCTWLPVLEAPDASSRALFERVVTGLHELLTRAGADIAWGRNAYAAVRDMGFVDATVHGYSEAWSGGTLGTQLHKANASQTRERLIHSGLATRDEIGDFLDLMDDPRFVVSSYLMLSTVARRPLR